MYGDENPKKFRVEKPDGGKFMPSRAEGTVARAGEIVPSTSDSGNKGEMKVINEIQIQNKNVENISKYCPRYYGARRYTYEPLSSENNSDFSEDYTCMTTLTMMRRTSQLTKVIPRMTKLSSQMTTPIKLLQFLNIHRILIDQWFFQLVSQRCLCHHGRAHEAKRKEIIQRKR